ncbi:MAG TPA: hypothetical protein PKC80_08025 [Burkholderiaceae bacterium]|nr:hypothetical protein [Burkholderiaceae bacterium]
MTLSFRLPNLVASVSLVLLAFFALASSLAVAAEGTKTNGPRVSAPIVEKAKGGECVADPAFMRRNHGDMLKHQRDDTLRGGIRTGKNSLKACIECHASKTTNSVNASGSNFCQSCHNFTAVKIDCFECHASKPAPTAFHPLVSPHGNLAESSASMKLRQVVVQQQVKP